MTGQPRIIKKYANRRLYDTKESRYITKDDIKRYVVTGVKFKVVHAQSGDELTRTVLMSIIFDEEIMGVPLFSDEALRSIIIFSGSPLRGSFSGFIEQMLPMLERFQPELSGEEGNKSRQKINEQYASLQGMLLGNAFSEFANRSIEMMMQANPAMAGMTGRKKDAPPEEKD